MRRTKVAIAQICCSAYYWKRSNLQIGEASSRDAGQEAEGEAGEECMEGGRQCELVWLD